MSMRTWCAVLVGALALGATASSRPAHADGNSWLGVYTQAITPELREGMNYNGSGALVRRVVDGSPADRAGVEQGDIIVRLDSRDVDSPDELADIVRALPVGRSVDLTVVRDDQKKSLTATLDSRDSDSGDSGDSDFDLDVPAPPGVPRAPKAPRPMKHPQEVRIYRDHDGDHDFDDDDDDDGDDDHFEFQMPDMGAMGANRGRLGVRIESLNPDLASYFGGRDVRGALVLEVIDGSAAEKAGIHAGDVITRVDGKAIASADDLQEAVRSSDRTASISLVRHGARQSVSATLGDMPKVMRLRQPGRSFNWNGTPGTPGTPRTRTFQWNGSPGGRWGVPEGKVRQHIQIDGDEMSPQSREEMRDELKQLRDELRKMREELNRLDRDRSDSSDKN